MTAADLAVAGILAAVAAAVVWFARTPRTRPPVSPPAAGGRTEECEVCGAEISVVVAHLVVEAATDDAHLGNTFGGTAMSAAYCVNHCPGDCTPATRPTHLL